MVRLNSQGVFLFFIVLLCCFCGPVAALADQAVTVRVVNSQGQPIEHVTVNYVTSYWQRAGSTDSQGEIGIQIPDGFSTITARVYYKGAWLDIRQNIRDNSTIVFHTLKTMVSLVNSKGDPLSGGVVKFGFSQWDTMGTTGEDGTISMELLPVAYQFTMSYDDGKQYLRHDIAENPRVEFQTIKTCVNLKDSSGAGLSGGKISYARVSWGEYGTTGTGGEAFKELLPGTYQFTMRYDDGKQYIRQNITENPRVEFQTIKTRVSLKDSSGAGLSGGKISYARVSWGEYGTTGAGGEAFKELLPGTYQFTMRYDDGKQYIRQNITENPRVEFQTVKTRVSLKDSSGAGLSGGKISYARVSWGEYGTTGAGGEAFKELLPGTYQFTMSYADGKQTIKQNISDTPTVRFNTHRVSLRLEDTNGDPVKGGQARYARVSWGDFGVTGPDGNVSKELISSTYTFRMYSSTGYEDLKSQITGAQTLVFVTEAPPAQTYTLSVSQQPGIGGQVVVVPDQASYNHGDVVTVTAIPADGFEFSSWSGTTTTAPSFSVEVTSDLSYTAVFKEQGDPQTVFVSGIDALNQAERDAVSGNVILLLEDGEYILPDRFMVTGDHVTIKSRSGDPSKVIIRGNGMNGSVSHVFDVYADYFTLEDVTIGWVRNHAVQVHGETDADHCVFRNVHFRDTYEQMIKVSYAKTQDGYSDGGIVEFCSFEYTAGIAPQWYVGGVDAHHAKDWVVRNNTFKYIKSPSSALSEGAVHFWSDSDNTIVDSNTIFDCDRGIMFGLDSSGHYGGIIRNNFVHVTRDVGIYTANTYGAEIYNNTVYVDSDYANAVEYRFEPTHVLISNNLTNRPITSRDNAQAALEANVETAAAAWFADADQGDLHLADPIFAVIDQGVDIQGLENDIDGDERLQGLVDIGADESALSVKPISEIHTEVDKTSIVSNGRDEAVVSTRVVYNDGSQAYIQPDLLEVEDEQGNRRTLYDDTFSSFLTGEYTIYSHAQNMVSAGASVTVVEEDLTQALPTNIQFSHRRGQTFIRFDEIVRIVDNPDIYYDELHDLIEAYPREITYNIYRSASPIASLAGLTPVGNVDSLSGWNLELYGMKTKDTHKPALRYTIEDQGATCAVDQGLFVYNPDASGTAYYAVTPVVGGVENKTLVPGENTGSISDETVGPGVPVLQSVESGVTFQYISNADLHLYTRWETTPNTAVPGRPYDYLVAVPENLVNPAPVGIHMHCWGGNLYSGYGWWNDAEDGSLLLASNQEPYDWWTGYHENLYTFEGPSYSWRQSDYDTGVVRPYSTSRLISFLDWMETEGPWAVDRSRTFTAGTSMGGSGSIMMAIRYPGLIAWNRSWVGVHDPSKSPTFKSSYSTVYGKPEYNVSFEDGTPVWDYYNDIWYLNNHVAKDIGFIAFANGKNDSAIGWEQAVDFINALQTTRQPHLFVWGQGGHSQRAKFPKNGSERHMEIDLRTDQSLPAFTRCSLDDNFGNGDPEDGDSEGQVNRYLYWQTLDITDSKDVWEITVSLMDTAPKDNCRVDITPRRLQAFTVSPGQTVSYQNMDIASGQLVDAGEITADQYGLLTIPQTLVSKTDNRIIIMK